MKATYHLIGTSGKPTGVAISVEGERNGYDKTPDYMASKDFDLDAGRAELIALKAEGYEITRGGDVTR